MPQPYAPGAMMEDGALDMESAQKTWMETIERHERKRKTWIDRCDKIVKIYADADVSKLAQRMYCVLWANVQTRAPTTYSREPKCVVSRRYQTPSEDVRLAVQALERVTNIQVGESRLHAAILSARLDRLLVGRGTIWVRYEQEDDGQKITGQKTCVEFVGYKDFGHGEGRVWEEVDCAWRRTYKNEDELKKRFGDDVMTRCSVTLDYAEKDATDDKRQATIYEVWCKSRNAVYWLARTARAALETGEPPLALKGFFPFPKPVYGTLTNENCIPTPDFVYYQDQADEITRLTRRIDKLTDSLKLVGFYPGGPSNEGRSEIERALSPGVENKMIPIPSWAGFAEKGGANAIVWLPVKDVAFIIESCVKLRQQLLHDVDQITGINDIERGQSDPSETLGAQQLKSQYGSIRQRDTKDDFVRFAKEAVEIIAEIAGEHFTPETLGRLSSIPPYQMQAPMAPNGGPPMQEGSQQPPMPQAPPQPVVDSAGQPVPAQWVQLLRNQLAREVLVDVETDSTIQPDEDAEKQRRVEMFDAVQKGMEPLVALQQVNPQLAAAIVPLWGDTLLFMLRGFRAGRELEETVEETVKKIQQLAQANLQPQPPQPTIDEQIKAKKVEQDGQLGNRKLDIEEHKVGTEAVLTHAKAVDTLRPDPAPIMRNGNGH